MKITTKKLPKSLLSLQIELDNERLERGLDQAARRLSQKYPIHGFRPGKAPRFMIERTFGRDALIEEATDDLVNKAFRDAMKEERIEPFGPASLQSVESSDPFTFTIHVPIAPLVEVGDYRAIQAPLELAPITDEQVARMLDVVRDRHVVLKELDEPRPAQEGDQLKVRLETMLDGEPVEPRAEDQEVEEQTLDLVKGRLVDELYAGLIGAMVGETREITAQMPDDHGNEQVRGKEATFKVDILDMQERMLPDWEDLTTLENFEGTLEELREKTRSDMEATARKTAERKVIESYINQLVEQTTFDIPDLMIEETAQNLLREQEKEFSRYGITLEQMLQYRGQTQDEAIEALMPDAERQTRVTLALRRVLDREKLSVSQDELVQELDHLLLEYPEEQRPDLAKSFQSNQALNAVANAIIDRKLRDRLIEIATGTAPALDELDAPAPAAELPAPAAPVDADTQLVATETPAAAE